MGLSRMIGVALGMLAMLAPPASAKTIVMRYYVKQLSVRLVNGAGQRVHHKRPVAGDVGDATGLAYVGDHAHHAKHWTASYHVRCVFRHSKRVTCDGQIAIGGSMLLIDVLHINSRGSFDNGVISGGTGVFQHAHGSFTSIGVLHTKDSDFIIRLTL